MEFSGLGNGVYDFFTLIIGVGINSGTFVILIMDGKIMA